MRVGVATAAALLGVVVGVAPASGSTWTPDQQAAAAPARAVLTTDGPRYRYDVQHDRVAVRAGAWAEPDHNRREVFHRPGAPASRSQTSCATWVHQSGPQVQEGLAVRIRDDRGRVRAVTLTKNVEFGLFWVFNVLTWDTARTGDPWRTVAQFDMSGVVGRSTTRLAALPWRVCLRATGRSVAFKVWLPGRMPEPSWSATGPVRHARLPRAFAAAGVPGWYVGHLPGHGRVVYRRLTTP